MLELYVVVDQKRFIDQDTTGLEGLQDRGKEWSEEIEEHQNPIVFLIAKGEGLLRVFFPGPRSTSKVLKVDGPWPYVLRCRVRVRPDQGR